MSRPRARYLTAVAVIDFPAVVVAAVMVDRAAAA
jgi:hypothetical protein